MEYVIHTALWYFFSSYVVMAVLLYIDRDWFKARKHWPWTMLLVWALSPISLIGILFSKLKGDK